MSFFHHGFSSLVVMLIFQASSFSLVIVYQTRCCVFNKRGWEGGGEWYDEIKTLKAIGQVITIIERLGL